MSEGSQYMTEKKSIQIDKETWRKLKVISLAEESSINDIIRSLVDNYFVKHKYVAVEDKSS